MNLNLIYSHYKQCNSLRVTAKEFKLSRTKLTQLFNNNGFVINDSYDKLHTLNEGYFDIIDNEHKAYWLGFIYADGYINEKSYILRIELGIVDKTHLMKFKDDIESSHNINYRSPRDTVYLKFASKQMIQSLIKHGLYSNKSLTMDYPKNIDDKYISHFLRGYFDGDGSLYYVGKKSAGIGIIGTKEFLNGFKNELLKHDSFKNLKIRPSRKNEPNYNVYRLETTNLTDAIKVMKWLYKDHTIHLDRKFDKYKFIHERTSTTTISPSKLVKANMTMV